jgi:hypothetical protein
MNSIESDDINLALPRRVLIAVDSSSASRNALAYARTILPHGGEVPLVSVAENPHTLFRTGRHIRKALDSVRDELLKDAAEALEQAEALLAHVTCASRWKRPISGSTAGSLCRRWRMQPMHGKPNCWS